MSLWTNITKTGMLTVVGFSTQMAE